MARRFFTEANLEEMASTVGVMQPLMYTLRGPMPQAFLVIRTSSVSVGAPTAADPNVVVRTVTLTPLSWNPYTMAVTVSLEDEKVVCGLCAGTECVLGLPSRDLLRQLTICEQWLPKGISEVELARLKIYKSLYVGVPSIGECPVNFECIVDHLEEYHGHLVAFVRVVGASINDELIFLQRDEIVSRYPTNQADRVLCEDGTVRPRVSLLSDLMACPTFPVAPKQGWYATFDIWMRDLASEGYLNSDEHGQVARWSARWEEVFADTGAPERAQLRDKLTHLIRLIANRQWVQLHAFLENVR